MMVSRLSLICLLFVSLSVALRQNSFQKYVKEDAPSFFGIRPIPPSSKRQCPSPAPLRIDEVAVWSTSIPDGCAGFYLTIYSNFTSDLLWTPQDSTNGTGLAFALVPPPYLALDFEWLANTSYQIPNCGLFPSNYLLVSNMNVEEDFEFSMTAVAPSSIRRINGQNLQISSTANNSPWDIIQLNLPDPSKAYDLTFQITGANTTGEMFFGFGDCPTISYNIFYTRIVSGRNNPISFRNPVPNYPFYVAITTGVAQQLQYNASTNFSKVACTVPTKTYPCKWRTIDWATPPVSSFDTAQLVNQLLEASSVTNGSCYDDLEALICSNYYYKCDANGFAIQPCKTDCTTATKPLQAVQNHSQLRL